MGFAYTNLFRMTNSSDSIEARRKEIASGKRSWHVHETPKRDFHSFYCAYVVPLHRIRTEGVIEKLAEHRDGQRVVRVDILGEIKLSTENAGDSCSCL